MYGDAIMNAGIHLKSAFAAVGYNDNVRFYQDYASRIYTITSVEKEHASEDKESKTDG